MNIILADDHALFRDSLEFLLSNKTDHHIVASVDSMPKLRQVVSEHAVDLVLLDYNMPECDTLAEANYLKHKFEALKVVFLTGSQSGVTLKHIHSAKIDGILHKEEAVEDIVAAIEQIMEGHCVLSARIQEKMANDEFDLTSREFHILMLITKGLTSPEIAETLHISPRTIEKHKQNIMQKMHCSNVVQLVAAAHRLNLEAH